MDKAERRVEKTAAERERAAAETAEYEEAATRRIAESKVAAKSQDGADASRKKKMR